MAAPTDPQEKTGSSPRTANARTIQVCLIVEDDSVASALMQALESRNRHRVSAFL